MINLTSTSDQLRVTTSGAVTTDVYAAWVDLSGTVPTPGRTLTQITTAATTSVAGAPAASTVRNVKTLHIRNRNASTSVDITVSVTDGTTPVELIKTTLPAGHSLHYDEGAGFEILDPFGRSLSSSVNGTSVAAINALNLVVLSADVTNNNATANTIADITGLSFPVTAGEAYRFQFEIDYTAAATTTGARFSVSGPGSPTRLSYRSKYSLTATSETFNTGLTAYDLPAASNASSASTAGNTAIINGFIQPSATGTVIARFASEIANSAIVAKRGSLLSWYRVF